MPCSNTPLACRIACLLPSIQRQEREESGAAAAVGGPVQREAEQVRKLKFEFDRDLCELEVELIFFGAVDASSFDSVGIWELGASEKSNASAHRLCAVLGNVFFIF